MIFVGREHPIFDSFIESSHITEQININTLQRLPLKGNYFTTKDGLQSGKTYFFHSEIPLIEPGLDIEYIFNIEDQMTMYRRLGNGNTSGLNFNEIPDTEFIKYVLEDPRCKKIVCHIEKMAQALPILLDSDIIKQKTKFCPIGLPLKCDNKKPNTDFTILFTNSFSNSHTNLELRGATIVLIAFKHLVERYPNIKLIFRGCASPTHEKDILEIPNIEYIPDILPQKELDKLYEKSDIFVLPSARVHSHSIVQAFSHGLPVITSNGWGIDEFVEHEVNGIILSNGKKISWHDPKIGCIEDYRLAFDNTHIINMATELFHVLDFLILNPHAMDTFRENIKITWKTKFSPLNWGSWVI